MKKSSLFCLIFSLVILAASLVVAQPVTKKVATVPSGSQTVYFSTGVMKDSTGDFYSDPIDAAQYLPLDLKTNPLTVGYTGTSAKGDSVGITIEGRYGSGTSSAWAVIDTVLLTFNNRLSALKYAKIDLNGYRPEQIRFHIKGFAANRSDTVIRTWLYLRKLIN